MRLLPISKLSATNQCRAQVYRKRVPAVSNWKTASVELSSGARNQHVAAVSRTEVCPTRDVWSQRMYTRSSKMQSLYLHSSLCRRLLVRRD